MNIGVNVGVNSMVEFIEAAIPGPAPTAVPEPRAGDHDSQAIKIQEFVETVILYPPPGPGGTPSGADDAPSR